LRDKLRGFIDSALKGRFAMSDAISSSPKKASRASSRDLVSFSVSDISSLAKSLRAAIAENAAPSQVQMLNWLAKAAGFQNFQSLRAATETQSICAANVVTSKEKSEPLLALSAHAAKALTQFDEQGRLHKWPHKFAVQRIAMWGLWLRFDAKKRYTEKDVNSVLKAWHTYGDYATLRRELVNMQLLARKSDCSEYWKVAQRPSDEVKAFLHALREKTTNGF
jgi:hypothetical protein